MKRRRRFNNPTRVTLIICTLLCLILIVVSFKYQNEINPIKTSVGNFIKPMQSGVNSIGSHIYSAFDMLRSKNSLIKENKELKLQIEQIKDENLSLIEDRNELANLRDLYKLDQGYRQYEKVAARVVSRDNNNWYNMFTIDKGSKDGIKKDMNVIAGNGLVGIVAEVGTSYSKVRSIIDDNSYVSGMFARTSDICDVKGDLETINEGYISVERISVDAEIEDGMEIVTSYVSDRYLEGILIGYVNNIEKDANNMTMTARLTPVVNFDRLDTVLVITELKHSEELEDMTQYD
ncbi:MAG: rod shape-determining protein MreC [Lachnospiraceae bacterium]|nr:rod shape-determining protein MreC [Lachnospiraceae bacterium]